MAVVERKCRLFRHRTNVRTARSGPVVFVAVTSTQEIKLLSKLVDKSKDLHSADYEDNCLRQVYWPAYCWQKLGTPDFQPAILP